MVIVINLKLFYVQNKKNLASVNLLFVYLWALYASCSFFNILSWLLQNIK